MEATQTTCPECAGFVGGMTTIESYCTLHLQELREAEDCTCVGVGFQSFECIACAVRFELDRRKGEEDVPF